MASRPSSRYSVWRPVEVRLRKAQHPARSLWDPTINSKLEINREVLRRLWNSLSYTDAQAAALATDPARAAAVVEKVYGAVEADLVAVTKASLDVGAKAAADDLGIAGFAFNEANPAAITWAEDHAGTLIVETTKQQVEAVRSIVSRGLTDGKGARKIACQVQDVVGLHSRDANAVYTFEQAQIKRLIAAHPKTPEATLIARAEAQATRYAVRLHRARAMAISRTELNLAANQGKRIAWRQAVSDGELSVDGAQREYIANPNTGHGVCADLDGQRVGFDEEFSMGDPPIHPRCVCTFGLRGATVL